VDRDALLAEYRTLDDPLDRWDMAKRLQAQAEQIVTLSTDMAARALAELHVDGWSYARIAEVVGVSRARVQQIVERGREVAL